MYAVIRSDYDIKVKRVDGVLHVERKHKRDVLEFVTEDKEYAMRSAAEMKMDATNNEEYCVIPVDDVVTDNGEDEEESE